MAVAPDVSTLFLGSDSWDDVPCDSSINPNYLKLSTSVPPNTQGYESFFSDTCLQTDPISAGSGLATMNLPTKGTAVVDYSPLPLDTSQASWASLNASRSATSGLDNTISPLQTCFDPQSLSNASISTNGYVRSPTASSFDHSNANAEDNAHIQKRRRRSDTASKSSESPTNAKRAKGRRASENVEPGSARAIYLEKNRKAANKCRSKQKMQQEELIESAREYERKNRLLKAEVGLLKADMRDLMDAVGKHAGCPDKRLQIYVQREADRLVAKDRNDVVAQLLSSEHDPPRGHA